MRFFTVLSLVSAVAAETFTVIVGGNDTITYNPTSINASNGDVVQFQFVSKNHTATQSTFAAPCTAMAGGVDSGFQDIATNATEFPVWSFTVTNASAPLWFYCRQTGHCPDDGMVFAINPTAAKSFADFQAAALAIGNTTSTAAASSSPAGTATSATASGPAAASAALPSQSATGAASSTNGASFLTMSATRLAIVVGLAVKLMV